MEYDAFELELKINVSTGLVVELRPTSEPCLNRTYLDADAGFSSSKLRNSHQLFDDF